MFPIFKLLRLVLLLAGGLGLVGCGTFQRDWEKAAAAPAPVAGMEGRWEGFWLSDVNGHQGKLRCLITAEDEGHYRARFHAKYRKIFSFSYTVVLQAQPVDGRFQFSGEADLGPLAGGLYRYEGQVERTNFFSTYACKYDRGTFQMSRPVSSGF